MNDALSSNSRLPRNGERSLPWLLLLFVGSGGAALIYEIVWFQLLQLVIGSSAISLGVLLGTFMGGMCLGSLLLPRWLPARWHPLRVYALLEFGIGVIGWCVLLAIPVVGRLYADYLGYGPASVLFRGLLCAVLLLPPTLLMGATLPAIARWVEATPRGVAWLGYFYGGNIAGAVFGCLLAGFYLLRIHDTTVATGVAVAINLAVAAIAVGLAQVAPHRVSTGAAAEPALEATRGAASVYLAIAISGMTALSAEVIWTRLLSLLLGGTVYTFSLILGVFLIGLGLGSAAGAALSRSGITPRLLFGGCQLLLGGAIAWAGAMLSRSLPFWPVDPSLTRNPWILLQLDLVRVAWTVLPGACLWGASFPLALATIAARGHDSARLVGGLYAANTLGAIVGALGTSMLLVAWVGTQQAQRILIGCCAFAGLLMLGPPVWTGQLAVRWSLERAWPRFAGAAALGVALAMTAGLGAAIAPVPWALVAYGRYAATVGSNLSPLYVGEGMNASVAVTRSSEGFRSFHVSGKVEASSLPEDMRLQRMLGHLSALMHPNPKSVLVVGCGAGVTAGCFVLYPEIERIVICEIEPLIPRVVVAHFGAENYHVLRDPRVEVVYDDARHYLLTTREQFDIITSDPIHPWVKGAATLYTQEYFDLCRRRLRPGGLITQWVPLYESTPEAVQSEMATFFRVFPDGTVWGNDVKGEGYDTVLLGRTAPGRIDVDGLQARLERREYARVRRSLADVGLGNAVSLLGTYAGCASDLQPWLATAQINRDRNLRLQYLAGMGHNVQMGKEIYEFLLSYRRFPTGLFIGSERMLRGVEAAMEVRW